ncbi:hypothetical protein [Chishuiella sp.]|uniref:hypothetical protein n=1 Tax=Chishuiella sp. TaxID=1969467 RepID=UPI0028AE1517|nr:hypothetical protein [Chishuiella sp.]
MNKKNSAIESEDSAIYQVARFIAIYDVYKNLISTKQNFNYFISEDFSKENMLVVYLSSLYSLFDDQKSAQSLQKINFQNQDIENLRIEIINDWLKIKDSLKIIRHNIGFHTSKKIEGQKKATQEFANSNNTPHELTQKLIELYIKYLEKKITKYNIGFKK